MLIMFVLFCSTKKYYQKNFFLLFVCLITQVSDLNLSYDEKSIWTYHFFKLYKYQNSYSNFAIKIPWYIITFLCQGRGNNQKRGIFFQASMRSFSNFIESKFDFLLFLKFSVSSKTFFHNITLKVINVIPCQYHK